MERPQGVNDLTEEQLETCNAARRKRAKDTEKKAHDLKAFLKRKRTEACLVFKKRTEKVSQIKFFSSYSRPSTRSSRWPLLPPPPPVAPLLSPKLRSSRPTLDSTSIVTSNVPSSVACPAWPTLSASRPSHPSEAVLNTIASNTWQVKFANDHTSACTIAATRTTPPPRPGGSG
ncbi:hypothetical protein QBC45DRAFT_394718 [Copromyces sp. CBS 386.78]|nr:hypothetical protein QBC45DRAFT_394718 [Copromyces sp. CBS 386.78]